MTLVSTHELDNSLSDNTKLIDASWHFLSNRNGFKEYQKEHIENAIFFDLEKHSNQQKIYLIIIFFPKKVIGKKHFQKWECQMMTKLLFMTIVI